jgi:hypothetical protein
MLKTVNTSDGTIYNYYYIRDESSERESRLQDRGKFYYL